jgi:hypothetical protein
MKRAKWRKPRLGERGFLGGEDLGKALTRRSAGIGKGSRQAAAAAVYCCLESWTSSSSELDIERRRS